MTPPAPSIRAIAPGEFLRGERVSLRLVTLEDCTPRYEAWLADPEVNRYLETRWRPQPLEAIREFVAGMSAGDDNYLFAIVTNSGLGHIGNLKVGPIVARHGYADVSYFIGAREAWGQGYASEAIRLANAFAFGRLKLHRLQAGLYAGNLRSAKALGKAGYRQEGALRGQLLGADGTREDHLWYGLLREEWESTRGEAP